MPEYWVDGEKLCTSRFPRKTRCRYRLYANVCSHAHPLRTCPSAPYGQRYLHYTQVKATLPHLDPHYLRQRGNILFLFFISMTVPSFTTGTLLVIGSSLKAIFFISKSELGRIQPVRLNFSNIPVIEVSSMLSLADAVL